MSKKIHDGHFKERRPHTIIKHRLFHSTLKNSLGIASARSECYVYLDLFAGDGLYEDGSEGSPIIALKEFSYYLKGDSRRLQRVFCAFCEKFGLDKLKAAVEHTDKHPAVSYTVCEDWEDAFSHLMALKQKCKFGFIFADQYATELNLRRFIDLVGQGRHDFLIFYNPMALKRLKGKQLTRHICKVLDAEEEEVEKVNPESFKEFILDSLRKKLRKLRNFVIIAAIPNTRKSKLTWSDYFYLVLGTNHPKVADAFVKAYQEAVDDFREYYGAQGNLFYGILEKQFKEFLLKVVQSINGGRGIDLYFLFLAATYEFLSWKKAVKFNLIVPTMENLVKALNELEKEGKIEIRAPSDYRYKIGKQRGLLKHNFSKLQDLKAIKVVPVK